MPVQGAVLTKQQLLDLFSDYHGLARCGDTRALIASLSDALFPVVAGGASPAAWQVVAKVVVGAVCPVDVTEDILATINLPALAASDVVKITTFWSASASTAAKTLAARLNGALIAQATMSAASGYVNQIIHLSNRNNTAIQMGNSTAIGGVGAGTSAMFATAIDTSVPTVLTLTAQKVTGTDVLTLEGYIVERLTP